jgi:hypothetical protein
LLCELSRHLGGARADASYVEQLFARWWPLWIRERATEDGGDRSHHALNGVVVFNHVGTSLSSFVRADRAAQKHSAL